MGAPMPTGGIDQDGKWDRLAQCRGGQVRLANIHEHARTQHDGVKDRTRAPQGELIRCPAGDEVIFCLWEPLLGERLILINIDWTGSHMRCSPMSLFSTPNWVLRTAIGPAILAAPAVGSIPRHTGGVSCRA